MVKKTAIEELLAAAHVDPKSFEAELGLLCHKWLLLKSLDHVIEALDAELLALEAQRDFTISQLPPRT